MDVPAPALRERFLPALAELFPAARDARVTDFFVTRERRATFRQVPGCERLRPGAATALPGLVLAGAWTDTGWPDTMEGAVRSGLNAARVLRRELAVPAGAFRPRDPGRATAGPGDRADPVPSRARRAREPRHDRRDARRAWRPPATWSGPALAAAVDRLSPEVPYRSRAYHLGPGRRRRRAGPGRRGRPGAGKALRPALALLSARAAGAAPERGVPAAVAVELVHNFSLLHDDIMDGDTERRHRPTAWTVYGIGAAILAGDAMLALAQDILLEDTAPAGGLGGPLPVRRGAAADRGPGRGPGVRAARRRHRCPSA